MGVYPVENNTAGKYNYQIGFVPQTTGTETDAIKSQSPKKVAKTECSTCANRRYVDGSNDPGVSFKTPTKLTPNQAAMAVPSHEREHYSREAENARQEGREVVSNEVRVFTSVCPECGRIYVSGGETRTITRKIKAAESFANNDYENKIAPHFGKKIDEKA